MNEWEEEQVEKEMESQKEEQQEEIEEEQNAMWLLYIGLFAFIKSEIFDTYSKTDKWEWAEVNKFNNMNKLLTSLNNKVNEFRKEEVRVFTNSLTSKFTSFYNSTMLLLGGSPKGAKKLTPEQIKNNLDFPWSGLTFSDRIWKNQELLKARLKEGLIQSAINGESIQQLTKRLEKEFKVSYNKSKRLVDTELARINYIADTLAFKKEGVKKVRYNAKNDKTCKDCAKTHGKEFRLGKEPALPRHANCRCFYTPVGVNE